MTTIPPVEFFVSVTAARVREMSVSEARIYLQGLLTLTSADHSIEPLRAIYRHLDLGDAQLELIATGQLKLDLGGDGQ